MDEWSSSTGILDTINPTIVRNSGTDGNDNRIDNKLVHKRVLNHKDDEWYSFSNICSNIYFVVSHIIDIFVHPSKYFITSMGFMISCIILSLLSIGNTYYAHKTEISTVMSEPVIGKFHNVSYCHGYGLACTARYDYVYDQTVKSRYIYGLNCHKIEMLYDSMTVNYNDSMITSYLTDIDCYGDKINLHINYVCHVENNVFFRNKQFNTGNINKFSRCSLFHYLPDDFSQEGLLIYPHKKKAYILKNILYSFIIGYIWLALWVYINTSEIFIGSMIGIVDLFSDFGNFGDFGDFDGYHVGDAQGFEISSPREDNIDDILYDTYTNKFTYDQNHQKLD